MSATNVLLAIEEGAQAQLDELKDERDKKLGELRQIQAKIIKLELYIALQSTNGNQQL